MALPSTVYRAAIELSHVDRGEYASLQLTVARHPSETAGRLVARLLAYALFYSEELAFTKGICAGDEPDLWVKGPDGRVQLWLEVGLPDAERLQKAARHAARVALLACGSGLSLWERQQLPKLAAVPNLIVVSVAPQFLARLEERLERTVSWALTVSDHTLYLDCGGETLESPLQLLAGGWE